MVGLDGTLYDQVLDTVFYLGLAPPRFSHLSGLELYFAMARGAPGSATAACCSGTGAGALDMSKWFDTNYHQLVRRSPDRSRNRGRPGAREGTPNSIFPLHQPHRLYAGTSLLQVPELDASSHPSLNSEFILEKVRRGQLAIGANKAVPILIGARHSLNLPAQDPLLHSS